MMTPAQVVETSANVTSNSPSQDYTHPDDHNLPNYDMTPGFKPFTVIPYSFENTLSDPFVLPNGTKLNSLLYADDVVILSRSKAGLQTCLNRLFPIAIQSWMLSINPKKTKVMIFQKRAEKCTESSFHIDNEIIEIVQNYTYLGTLISSTGNFSMAFDKLKEKALQALFSRRKHTNISKLSPLLANKIFDMMISPILTYNSEIWGVYVKPDFKSWDRSQIEKLIFSSANVI